MSTLFPQEERQSYLYFVARHICNRKKNMFIFLYKLENTSLQYEGTSSLPIASWGRKSMIFWSHKYLFIGGEHQTPSIFK